uniref:Uncharacterized protein n=1 Tax=Cajanus cajan TaxID=3821 RepID=A0A151UDK6_CAJCA
MIGSYGVFPTNLPNFFGKHFDQWCVKIGIIFGFQEVLEIVKNIIQEMEEGATETQQETYRELKKKECETLFLIYQYINSINFEKICSANSTKMLWIFYIKCIEVLIK